MFTYPHYLHFLIFQPNIFKLYVKFCAYISEFENLIKQEENLTKFPMCTATYYV